MDQHGVGDARRTGRLHLLKFGVDLLHSGYEGTSDSAPVIIETSNGTPVRRLDFSGPRCSTSRSTDVALFAQDRLQPGARWYLEFGGRIVATACSDRVRTSRPVGTAVLLD